MSVAGNFQNAMGIKMEYLSGYAGRRQMFDGKWKMEKQYNNKAIKQ
jgi:hypothetical protein